MLEQGQQTTQNTVKSVAKSVSGQLGFDRGEASPDNQAQSTQNQAQSAQATGQNQKQPAAEAVPQAVSTEETKRFVKEFYAPSDDESNGSAPINKQTSGWQTQAKTGKSSTGAA